MNSLDLPESGNGIQFMFFESTLSVFLNFTRTFDFDAVEIDVCWNVRICELAHHKSHHYENSFHIKQTVQKQCTWIISWPREYKWTPTPLTWKNSLAGNCNNIFKCVWISCWWFRSSQATRVLTKVHVHVSFASLHFMQSKLRENSSECRSSIELTGFDHYSAVVNIAH